MINHLKNAFEELFIKNIKDDVKKSLSEYELEALRKSFYAFADLPIIGVGLGLVACETTLRLIVAEKINPYKH